jgi:hypothetical protein
MVVITEADVASVRERIAAENVIMRPKTDREMIRRVVEWVGGDADLAADAILMQPRPEWLFALIGMDMSRLSR